MKHTENQLLPQAIIREALVRAKNKNAAFSNNALAKSVGVSSGFISQFLSGKKNLSVSTALALSRALKMNDEEEMMLIKSLEQLRSKAETIKSSRKTPNYVLERDQQLFLSRWYHLAIADLTRCQGYRHDPAWIAKKLKISKLEVEEAIERLIRIGVIKKTEKGWTKVSPNIQLPTDKSQALVREFHKKMMQMAVQHMESHTTQEHFKMRSIRGRTLAINPNQIEKAKSIIQDFMDRMTEVLEVGSKKDVYQLNVQFFPLTNKSNGDV